MGSTSMGNTSMESLSSEGTSIEGASMKITSIPGLEEKIASYPVFEYQLLETKDLVFEERVRTICRQECERYGTTWACPPAVGELEECRERCRSYLYGLFFSTVAEVGDVLNLEETLGTRRNHEEITEELGAYFTEQGYEIWILSTESCDICQRCTYPQGPCRHPERMHPCLESHGVVVSQIVEDCAMTYQLGGNALLWFSLILFRRPVFSS